jgi:hypothetical protein
MRPVYQKLRQALLAVALLTHAALPAVAEPYLAAHEPADQSIPANTLRIFLTFSEPMARGQSGQAIRLLRADGSEIENPFLNLGVELWGPEQRRLTLLFDPGRLKPGVGPNVQQGAPLTAGETVTVLIDGAMKAASGQIMGQDLRVSYQVIEAERRIIAPADWGLEAPRAGTRDALRLTFTRQIDSEMSKRLIRVVTRDGTGVAGQIISDGQSWQFLPNVPWTAGPHRLRISPDLEDISGNRVHAPFDAEPGTIGRAKEVAERAFNTL